MSTHEWKPGDVAMVNDTTRPDAPWKVAMCVASAVRGISETRWRIDSGEVWGSVSQARPLVVIDPEDREAVERLLTDYLTRYDGMEAKPQPDEVSYMQAALREFASPTPPKPEEPRGLGAVVEDAEGDLWTSVTNRGASDRWQPNNLRSDAERKNYADIAVVRVLSEGVQ